MNERPMDDAPTGRGMLDLPPECLTRVGTLVGSLADMLSLGQVCRALRDCDRDWLWRARVEADFGLRLPPAGSGVKPPKALYIEFHRQRSGRVRFQGCYTDGGCDASARRYWVRPSPPLFRTSTRPPQRHLSLYLLCTGTVPLRDGRQALRRPTQVPGLTGCWAVTRWPG